MFYLSIPKLKRLHRWSLGMDNLMILGVRLLIHAGIKVKKR